MRPPGTTRPDLQPYAVMGALDDAIREHLELKRRLGASEDELQEKETEAFGARGNMPVQPSSPATTEAHEEPLLQDEPEHEPSSTQEPPPVPAAGEPDPWAPAESADDLLQDEVLPGDALEPNGAYSRPHPEPTPAEPEAEEPHEDPLDEWEAEPAPPEDVLQETPEFLEETPEHDRLWFEQKPPRDFDFE